MAKVTFKPNRQGTREFLQSNQVRKVVRPRAEAVLREAQQTAAFVDQTGDLRGSLRLESDTTDRAVERVVAVAPYAIFVEAKTGFLNKALRAAKQ